MEIYNGKLCITHAELTRGIISETHIKQLRYRGQLSQVRRACLDTPALFEVESLPLRYRTEVYRRNPDWKEQAASRPFVDEIVPDPAAERFFHEEFTLPNGDHLPADKAAELASSAAILNAFAALMERSDSQRLRLSKRRLSKTEFWKRAAEALPRISEHHSHNLPESPRRLERKFRDYQAEGYAALVSRKWGNANAAAVDDEVKQSLLMQLIAHHNNLDNAAIARFYNLMAEEQGWRTITAGAVGKWKERWELETSAGRGGQTRFRNNKTMQVKRSRPTAPMLMWTVDGWDVELLYQTVKENKKGHRTISYDSRLTAVVVLDPSCNYPMGFAIGTHETPDLIRAALANALQHTRQLWGEMLRVCQLQCDRYALKALTPIYTAAAEKLTPARAKNAKAKVIEPYFGYLNKTYCQLMNNWSGFGITTNPSRQPNSEALNMLRKNFPTFEELHRQFSALIAVERQKKIGKLQELYENLPADRRLPMPIESYLLHFGHTTGHLNAQEGSGLRPTILGERRDYDCFDARFRQLSQHRWQVRYDPTDLSHVLAMTPDGRHRFLLEAKHVQPMALADRKEGDAEQLERVMQFNRELEAHVTDRLSLAYERTEQLIAHSPTGQNILSRLLLTDSRGQHKLRKAEKRLGEEVDFEEVPTLTPSTPFAPTEVDEDDPYSIF